MSSASFLKRLETLEKAIMLNRPRQIVLLVDGNADDTKAETELLATLAVQAEDLIVCIKKFGSGEGLPRLLSII